MDADDGVNLTNTNWTNWTNWTHRAKSGPERVQAAGLTWTNPGEVGD